MDGDEWEAWFRRMNDSPSKNAASEGSPVPLEDEVLFGELVGPILEGPCWWDERSARVGESVRNTLARDIRAGIPNRGNNGKYSGFPNKSINGGFIWHISQWISACF